MMESTPSRDNRDIILDITLFSENLVEVTEKAKVFALSVLSISMAVLSLITTIYSRRYYEVSSKIGSLDNAVKSFYYEMIIPTRRYTPRWL